MRLSASETEAQEAAARFRREHHLGDQPLGDLAALIEQVTGVEVAVVTADSDEHGLTMRDPARDAVFVAVARTPNPMRQRSSLAHELGHVVFEDWSTGPLRSERSPAEIRADAFGRHLLLPLDGLRTMLGPPRAAGLPTLSEVVQRFLVSPALAVIALHQAGYIDEAAKHEWRPLTTRHLAARYGWTDQYEALSQQAMRHRAPQRLTARAVSGYLAHVVSARTIATLRGVDVSEILTEFRDVGLEPTQLDVVWADPTTLPTPEVDLSALDEFHDTSGSEGANTAVEQEGPVG